MRQARAIGEALVAGLRALPEGFDLLRLKKMPAEVGSVANPLVSLGRPGSCSVNGNLVLTGDDYAAYEASIKRMQIAALLARVQPLSRRPVRARD